MSRPPRPVALLGLAAALSAIGLGRSAAGEEPSAAGQPVIVLLAPEIEGSDVDDRAVGTLGARVRATGIKVVVVRRKADDLRAVAADSRALITTWGARGALWIDVGRPDEAALYLVTRDGEQVFGRTIPAPEGKTSATLETLANIAASVSEELLEGRIVELKPVEVPAPAPPLERTASPNTPGIAGEPIPDATPAPSVKTEAPRPVPPPARPRQAPPGPRPAPPPSITDQAAEARFPRLGLAVGYTGDTFGETVPWQSAVSLRLSLSPSSTTFVGLGYDVAIPVDVDLRFGGYEIARHPIVVAGGYRILFPEWDIRLGARMTMDIVEQRLDPLPRPPPGGPPPPPQPGVQTDILFTGGPVVDIGVSFAGRFRAGALLGMDILFNQPSPAPPPLALEPNPVRFVAGLSLGMDIFVPEAKPPSMSAKSAPAAR